MVAGEHIVSRVVLWVKLVILGSEANGTALTLSHRVGIRQRYGCVSGRRPVRGEAAGKSAAKAVARERGQRRRWGGDARERRRTSSKARQ